MVLFCNAVEEETNNLLKRFSSPLKYMPFLFVPAGAGFSRSKGEDRRGEVEVLLCSVLLFS